MSTENIQGILKFWFDEVTPKQKFTKDPELDALIKARFESVYWDIMNGKTKEWRQTVDGRLAEIIVLDQFARNMFRDDTQAFAGDALAFDLAREALVVQADKEIQEERRSFFYMPFMHSESKDVHEEALKIFTEFGNETILEYEIIHKAIIDKFGRYPHRNEALGRESTPEELAWLEAGGGF